MRTSGRRISPVLLSRGENGSASVRRTIDENLRGPWHRGRHERMCTLVSEVSAGFRSCGTTVFFFSFFPSGADRKPGIEDCLRRHAMSWSRFCRRASKFGDTIAAKASDYSASRDQNEWIHIYIAFSFNWIALEDGDFTYTVDCFRDCCVICDTCQCEIIDFLFSFSRN